MRSLFDNFKDLTESFGNYSLMLFNILLDNLVYLFKGNFFLKRVLGKSSISCFLNFISNEIFQRLGFRIFVNIVENELQDLAYHFVF